MVKFDFFFLENGECRNWMFFLTCHLYTRVNLNVYLLSHVGGGCAQKRHFCERFVKFHGHDILCTHLVQQISVFQGVDSVLKSWCITCLLTRRPKCATCCRGGAGVKHSVKVLPETLASWYTSVWDDSFSKQWCHWCITIEDCETLLKYHYPSAVKLNSGTIPPFCSRHVKDLPDREEEFFWDLSTLKSPKRVKHA